MKFNDINGNGVQDAGEPGLIGWTIHLFDTGTMALLQTTVRRHALDGSYSFILCRGATRCARSCRRGGRKRRRWRVPPPAGETLANCAPFGAANGLTLGPRGYSFTIMGTEIFPDNDFGNFQQRPQLSEVPDPGRGRHDHARSRQPDPDPEIINAVGLGKTLLILPLNGKKTESITINKRISSSAAASR